MSTAGRTPSPSGSTAAGAPTSKDPPGRLGRGLGGLESMIRAREAFRTARGARRRVAGSCHAARPARSSSASTCCSADAGKKRPRVVVLTGPTGVGKTSTSLSLAERLNAEIISADSVQVYRGLDIGSDKVPKSDRRGIRHHLIDILPPKADFSAGDFHDRGREAVEEILQRGKTPLVVGGTGFYLQWFLHGKADTPRSTPDGEAAVKLLLEKEYAKTYAALGRELTDTERWDVGVRLVREAGDARSADRLMESRNNYYRLHRILEVITKTGGPMPGLREGPADLDYDFRCFFLHRPRIQMYRRIDQRCEQMVTEGILLEALELRKEGVTPDSCNAARAIGYRQALEFAYSNVWEMDEESQIQALQAMTRDMQTASRRLVTRQLTWFRDNPTFRWVGADQVPEEEVVTSILEDLQQPTHSGGSGDYGRLTRDEEWEVKRYRSVLKVLDDPCVCREVLRCAGLL